MTKLNTITLTFIILVIIVVTVLANSMFCVDQREQVIVTQFGRPVGDAIDVPGLHFKIPFVQEVHRFAKRTLAWESEKKGYDVMTGDKENITIQAWARWRIKDPMKFFTAVGDRIKDEHRAKDRLTAKIESAIKNIISAYPLTEILRDSNRELKYTTKELEDSEKAKSIKVEFGRSELEKKIRDMASADPNNPEQNLVNEFGIELLDVRIKQIHYIDSVRKKIYERMQSERNRIADALEAEGQQAAIEIEGELNHELARIASEGYREAQEIKGKADGEAARIYAEAYGQDPEFYAFYQTLQTYKNTIDGKTTLFLDTNSQFFKYLRNSKD